MRRPALSLLLAVLLALATLCGSRPAQPALAALRWPNVTLQGKATSWSLTLQSLRRMETIPHTTWSGYKSGTFTMWVLTLKMTNTGNRSANILEDLMLTLKVLPNFHAANPSGWTAVAKYGAFIPLVQTTAQEYGGVRAVAGHQAESNHDLCLRDRHEPRGLALRALQRCRGTRLSLSFRHRTLVAARSCRRIAMNRAGLLRAPCTGSQVDHSPGTGGMHTQ